MPLHLVLQSVWYRVAGFSILSLRSLSVCFALSGVVSWYVILVRWTSDRRVAGLAVGFLGIDYFFQSAAAAGRSDATAFGLGSMAIAAYLVLNRTRPKLAQFAGHSLVAMSGMTHPVGGLVALGGMILVQTQELTKRCRWSYLVWSAAPYLIGSLLWGAYILQDAQAFRDQFFGNSAGRLWPFLDPLRAVREEFTGHYLTAFGGTDPQIAKRARILVLAFYVGAVIATWAVSWIRSFPGVANLRRMTIITATVLLFFEGAKQGPYMIYLMPCFAAAGGLLLIWITKTPAAVVTLPAICCIVILQLTFSVYNIYRNPYASRYVPAARFLSRHGRGGLILGPAELGLEVPNVVEDTKFGRISGKTAAFIVLSANSGDSQHLLAACGGDEQSSTRLKRTLANEYKLVYHAAPFEIFQRTAK
jgi:hypothetical protein